MSSFTFQAIIVLKEEVVEVGYGPTVEAAPVEAGPTTVEAKEWQLWPLQPWQP